MEFSREEYCSGLPFPSPGDLPDPGIKSRSPALQADSLPSEPPGKPSITLERVAQLCLTLCDPIDCSPAGSSVHGILQARILEWVAISFSRGSSKLGDQTQVSCIAGWFFTNPPQFNAWILTQADSGSHWSPLWVWFGAIILALSTALYSWMLLHLVIFPNGLQASWARPCFIFSSVSCLSLRDLHRDGIREIFAWLIGEFSRSLGIDFHFTSSNESGASD